MKKFFKNWLDKRGTEVISVLLFFITALLLSFNINKPFIGEHDWNGARYGNIAKNYLRYGLVQTQLGQVENGGLAKKDEFIFNTHYPPTLPLLIALSYSFLGISEWSTRVVPAIFTSGSIVLIFLIGKTLYGFKFGVMATFLVLFTPIILYFGKNPMHEPVVIFFILLATLGFIKWQSSNLKKYKLLFFAAVVLAELTTWAGYFIVPALTFYVLVKREKKIIKDILLLWPLSLIIFSLHIFHTFLLTKDPFGGYLVESFLQRTSLSQTGRVEDFNVLAYLNRLRLWLFTLYSATLSLLSFLGFVIFLKKREDSNYLWVLTFGLPALIYFLLFSNAVFIHNYLTWYLLPFMALSGAAGLIKILQIKYLKEFKHLIVVSFILLIAIERWDFLKALNSSKADLLSVEVAKAINQKVNFDKTVLVLPKSFFYAADKFLHFYGDRKFILEENGKRADVVVDVDVLKGTYRLTYKND